MISKLKIVGLLMGALFLLAVPGVAKAQGWGGCDARVRSKQYDLEREINRHGYWSSQAQEERRELDRALANCGYRYGGYGYPNYGYRNDRNWWRRDGDHDRDDHWRRDRDHDGDHDRDRGHDGDHRDRH